MNKIVELYQKGLSNTQIAKEMNCSISNVSLTLKRNGLKNTRQRRYTKEQFMDLYNQGYNDCEIAKKLNNISSKAIQAYRVFLNLPINDKNRNIKINDIQKQVLIGTILGDTYISVRKETARGMFAHSLKQEDYFLYKKDILKSITGKTCFKSQERNGKRHYCIYTHFISLKELKIYHEAFYTETIKNLPGKQFIYDNFTELSFAIWYGDDGFKMLSGKRLSTNSFSYENQIFLQKLLKERLDIDTTLYGKEINKYTLYIPAREMSKVNTILNKYLKGVLDYKI